MAGMRLFTTMATALAALLSANVCNAATTYHYTHDKFDDFSHKGVFTTVVGDFVVDENVDAFHTYQLGDGLRSASLTLSGPTIAEKFVLNDKTKFRYTDAGDYLFSFQTDTDDGFKRFSVEMLVPGPLRPRNGGSMDFYQRSTNPGSNRIWQAGQDVVDLGVMTRVAAVPELSGWAMMIVGFGTVGALLRDRRRYFPVACR